MSNTSGRPCGPTDVIREPFTNSTKQPKTWPDYNKREKTNNENRAELTQPERVPALPRAAPPRGPLPGATRRRRQPADKQLWLNKYRPRRRAAATRRTSCYWLLASHQQQMDARTRASATSLDRDSTGVPLRWRGLRIASWAALEHPR